jgi:hypothetical protein
MRFETKKLTREKETESLKEDLRKKGMSEFMKEIKERNDILTREGPGEERVGKNYRESAKQRDEDEDAMAKLYEAMDYLRKFLGELMKKVPLIESSVRWKGSDGYNRDPDS